MAVSGLLLAHASSLDPRVERPLPVTGSGSPDRLASLDEVMPINDLLIASLKAVQDRRVRITTAEGSVRGATGPAAIERALFRPATGTVQVLLRDAMPLEVVLDWKTAQVLSVAPRHEWRWARVHSAAAAGESGRLVADAIAGLIGLMSLTGIWVWFRDRARTDLDLAARVHRRAGLVASVVLLVPAVTGVVMNRRADLGFTYASHREVEAEQIVRSRPSSLPDLMTAAVTARAASRPGTIAADIDWLVYLPGRGHIAVGFQDGTDVFVDVYGGELLAVMPPRDTWVRQIHSGRLFGAAGWVMTDLISLLWIVVTGSGLYVALRSRRREGVRT